MPSALADAVDSPGAGGPLCEQAPSAAAARMAEAAAMRRIMAVSLFGPSMRGALEHRRSRARVPI